MKKYFSADATSFLRCILERDPEIRIGGFNKNGNELDDAEDIRRHPFFKNIDWKKVKERSHMAPFIPKVLGSEDTSCIDQMFTEEELEETYVDHGEMLKELNPI